MYPVYLITCTHPSYGDNPKKYVGCILTEGKTIEKRFTEHCNNDGAKYLHNAIIKHGREWFKIEQIDSAETVEEVKQLEIKWIAELNTKSPNGYNISDGGDGGGFTYVHTEETKQRLRKLAKERHRKSPNPFKGKKHTEETRRKISESTKGRVPWNKGKACPKQSEETKRKRSESHKRYLAEHPEARQQMSEKLKQIRAAKFWSSRKKQTIG